MLQHQIFYYFYNLLSLCNKYLSPTVSALQTIFMADVPTRMEANKPTLATNGQSGIECLPPLLTRK